MNVDDFLKELADLTNKYNIQITGCGCCGSPLLVEAENSGYYTVQRNEISSYCEYLTFHRERDNNE
jgi:hypothetical protein